MKRYNTPHRRRVIKTRLTEEEYAEFSERVTLCKMSQAEFIRQALTKSSIRPVITVSPVNDELLSAVGKLTTAMSSDELRFSKISFGNDKGPLSHNGKGGCA